VSGNMERSLIILGSLLMFVGVGAGAFGAHGLEAYFKQHPDLESTYDSAVRYHQIHAIGLLIASWLSGRLGGPLPGWAGGLFLAGIILFSGSLYLLVFTRVRWLGAITPFGGVAFLGGWLCLALAAWRA